TKHVTFVIFASEITQITICNCDILLHATKIKMMKKNMGTVDRLIRIFAAFALLALIALDAVSGILGIISIVVAVVFLFTSMISFCPLYALFGIKTCKIVNSK